MTLMAIDGNSLVNRAYYGVRMLNSPDGTPTNAIYGFLAILRPLLEEYRPDALAVAFDRREPTFRHRACDFYKAQRKPMPEDLAVQMPVLKELLDAMGVARLELAGYEADDILGTLSAQSEAAGDRCLLVTGDRDALQLVDGQVGVVHVVTRGGKSDHVLVTPEVFQEEYGFGPKYLVDLKALMGDSSDNIPGVPGVGEKTALDLVRRYGSLDGVYEALQDPQSEMKESLRKKLREGEESARTSYWLATIFREVPLEKCETCASTAAEDLRWSLQKTPELLAMMKRLGFRKLIEQWKLDQVEVPSAGPSAALQVPSPEEGKEGFAEVRSVEDAEALEDILRRLKEADWTAVSLPDGDLATLELCPVPGDGTVYRLAQMLLEPEAFDAALGTIFSDAVKKSAHGVKDLMNRTAAAGLSRDGFVFDTALAGYLLRATDSDYSIPALSMRWQTGEDPNEAAQIAALTPVLTETLEKEGMTALFQEIEMPLCRVLSEMEEKGFLVDRAALSAYGEGLTAGISALEEEIYALAGHPFNILSPRQLGTVLFEELMLPAGKKTKTGWSTNADVLERLRDKHAIVQKVLDYRTLTKLKSTYADGLLRVIGPDGRIHTSFQMTVTATGRLSSTEPNLQNIPVRRELGAQIRTMFAAPKGSVLVDADYSQIELRLLAHISGDAAMQQAFLSGEDFHAVTASQVFNVPLDEVTHAMRASAKAVNFGIVYGISAFSLAQDIGVRPAEAKAYMEAYLNRFTGVKSYMHNVVEQARAEGCVRTLWNRKRDLPELKSANFNTRAFGERVALNMPIQGTAADIIKLAMVRVRDRLMKEGLGGRLVLQVHDELIVECPEEEAERTAEILREEMEQVMTLSVPLTVEAKYGRTWAEAH